VGGLEGVVLEHLSPHSLYGGEGDEKGGTVPAFDFRQHEQLKKRVCDQRDLPISSIEWKSSVMPGIAVAVDQQY
jgi:hypothetical protein